MASSKDIIRSVIVLILILSFGFLGLWFLGGEKINIKNQGTSQIKTAIDEEINDKYEKLGGKTPQETLKMLITALEKNDLTLATQYFIPENRETASEDLSRLDNTNLLSDLIKDLKNIKSGKLTNENYYYFEVLDEINHDSSELEFVKNKKGFWKIISL